MNFGIIFQTLFGWNEMKKIPWIHTKKVTIHLFAINTIAQKPKLRSVKALYLYLVSLLFLRVADWDWESPIVGPNYRYCRFQRTIWVDRTLIDNRTKLYTGWPVIHDRVFCYLAKSYLPGVPMYSSLHGTNHFLQCIRKTRPCLSGQFVDAIR